MRTLWNKFTFSSFINYTMKCVRKLIFTYFSLKKCFLSNFEHSASQLRLSVSCRNEVNMKGWISFFPCESVYSVKETYPDAVLLPILFPVPATITEHQEVAGHPVGAPIPSLGSHSSDLHSLPKVNLQPLVFVGHKWRPATSSFCKNRNRRKLAKKN